MVRSILIWACLSLLFFRTNGQEAKLVLPIGHTGRVFWAEFSSDQKRILTASDDRTAKIWRAEDGVLLVDLYANTEYINSARFSKDGKRVVTSSDDKTAKIWDAESGKLLSNLAGHSSRVTYAEFSPDGKLIVTSSLDGTAKVWDANTGDILWKLTGHADAINYARFSNDGNLVLTVSSDKTARIWDLKNRTILFNLVGHKKEIKDGNFSNDDKRIVTISNDTTAKVWDSKTGRLLSTLTGHRRNITSGQFSPDDKRILTTAEDSTVRIWDAEKLSLLTELGNDATVRFTQFTPGGNELISVSAQRIKIWDGHSGKLLYNLEEHVSSSSAFPNSTSSAQISPDGKKLITTSSDHTAKVWDIAKGTMLLRLTGKSTPLSFAIFNNSGKRIFTASSEGAGKIWDTRNGNLLYDLREHISAISFAEFSPDDRKLITISSSTFTWDADDSIAKVWDIEKGHFLFDLVGHSTDIESAHFSTDGKKIITREFDGPAIVWDSRNGNELFRIITKNFTLYEAIFDHNNLRIATTSSDGGIRIWNSKNGSLLSTIRSLRSSAYLVQFTNDDKKIIARFSDSTVKIWNVENGELLLSLKEHGKSVLNYAISPDDKKIAIISSGVIKIWDLATGNELHEIKDSNYTFSLKFSPDSKSILTTGLFDPIPRLWDAENGNLLRELKGHSSAAFGSYNSTGDRILTYSADTKVWNSETGKELYTFISIDSSDYLVYDKDYHYDGTPGARKLLYFTCGSEIIDLDQVKESLWVPDLADRINRGEKINSPKLSELDICGLTPVVIPKKEQANYYSFIITPRKGGLGETHLLVNGNVTKRYQPNQLKKTGDGYELTISAQELEPYLLKGQDNPISVKAYTSNNTIYSRGAGSTATSKNSITTMPNLYAIVIGINNYKGISNLNYAEKDAKDMEAVLSLTTGKLLNSDGNKHVFTYNFNTGANRYSYPDKKNIKTIFDTIAKKATANDILLIFFAGHGTFEGTNKKQFYLLTSDASTFTDVDSAGISTRELIDWIKPEKIKAQKRILIMDACNSAAALTELKELILVRNKDASETKKEIERLNDQAGMYVLSASASNQGAYELGKFSQGLLTYALLKSIKQQPNILVDKKFLNVGNWFSAAERTVNDILKEIGNLDRQQPQHISNANFNIGIVDQQVIDKIVLEDQKAVFVKSEFKNSGSPVDDLKFRNYIDKQISEQSSVANTQWIFQGDYGGSDAFSLRGDYRVSGSIISVNVYLIRGETELINKQAWKFTGKTDQLETLAAEIIKKGIANLPKK